ncbi:FAD-dependent oxidoreductase [Sediminibacillus albus]|uniref:Glycine/D-amino acid oxidase n=1 Tax=Sediminibacillus albus TaxID=407036 RepID=A0A1G8VSJ7_9BACI|nr:FAD-dependent oxidoreductase [Sediminibacillus albus]SDJ68817.1 Glycine/D-amino acid oxidase [Sediminibacillus albus]
MTKHGKFEWLSESPDSLWRETVKIPDFPRLRSNLEVDIGIVGGGITGITAAYLLAKEGYKIALMDAGKLLEGTTGNTTAKITAQHGLIYDELIQQFGEDTAELYYQFNQEAMELIEELIDIHQIECGFSQEDAYIYTASSQLVDTLKKEKQAYDILGIDNELVSELPIGLSVEAGLKMKNQYQFHPLEYLRKLVEKLEEQGVQIFEETTATGVDNKGKPTIETKDGFQITCEKVVEASHFPFTDARGVFSTRMYPERSYVVAAKSARPFPGGMYASIDTPTRSIRSVSAAGENWWLIGGEGHKTGKGGNTAGHYQALAEFAETHFEAEAYPYYWSAQDLTTLDKMPFIGPISDDQSDILVATGYRKWGMTLGTGAAMMITDIILQRENRFQEVFSPSRFHADPDLVSFAKYNTDSAKELIKGKLEYTSKNVEDIPASQADIIRVKGKRTGVYKDPEGHIHMVDTTCTHMGCEVNWNEAERTWDCPCHGSRFTATGEVIEGPAKIPLKKKDN